MNNYGIGDILFFTSYYFNDTRESLPHYGIVILPSILMDYDNNVLCSVVTSSEKSKTEKYCVALFIDIHKCFSKQTYCCLNRRDIQSLVDLDQERGYPLSTLTKEELIKCFNLLKSIKYSPHQKDKYLIPTIIREWKLLLYN
jgi:hypothetical protein